MISESTTGGEDLLAQLQQDTRLVANATAKAGLADMALLFQYLDMFGITARVSQALSRMTNST